MTYKNLTTKIYEEVRTKILKGQFKIGDKISERSLRETYESSRTPIREAIKMLEREGWVYALPKKGTFVAGLNLEQVHQIFQVRIAIEPVGALLAVEKITEEDKKEFEKILEDLRQAHVNQDIEKLVMKDTYLHILIAEKSGNSILANIVKDLASNIMRLGIRAVSLPERHKVNIQEWEKLIHAIINRNGFEASNWLSMHLMNGSVKAVEEAIRINEDTFKEKPFIGG